MPSMGDRAVAIVGVGAILPDAPNAPAYWQNICNKRYSLIEVPPERWSIEDYYDPDPSVPDKTYSKIGGWIRDFEFDWKRFRVPPKVAAAMDESQQWAVTIAAEALDDYGFPDRNLATERTGVILGTAMGGEMHNLTNLRVSFPEYARSLASVSEFAQLPADVRQAILSKSHAAFTADMPQITEDTMPGELANIVSGRVANVLNLRGPNYITDAACASSFASVNAAFEMLTEHHVDAVVAGGVDRNMGASTFIKFAKIGALSATGSRPFGDGADGFVMGEGSASFLLKRLSDAERDGDRIYAVIRGVGASSDGKGKGITAPNPVGQVLSLQRAWKNAGIDPATATLIEAHGTSTRVGDAAELDTLATVFKDAPAKSIALGSAKSNIGHLKAGAGAAGLLKAAMALHYKILPPTLNAEKPNPNFDFDSAPFFVNHELREWSSNNGTPRRAGVSAYGFGGTNFHLVLEEHVPGLLTREERSLHAGVDLNGHNPSTQGDNVTVAPASTAVAGKPPIRGILAIGANSPTALKDKLDDTFRKVESGWIPEVANPPEAELAQNERLVIDFGDHNELLDKVSKARKAAGFDNPQAWRALQAQGIFRGRGPKPGKIGFLFPGQGSQYVNMGRQLAAIEPAVAHVFADADQVMAPILGKPLTSYIFVDANDPEVMKKAERDLMQTAITQPAMLTMDAAVYNLLSQFGFHPDVVMGHSLGEYGALVAAGIMPFAHALEASAARGAEMTKVSMDDNGWMAAVFAPHEVVEQTLAQIDGYVVAANINSTNQSVVGGASKAVEKAIEAFTQQGFRAMRIPVSHAFHTKIVAPASGPLRVVLDRLSISPPQIEMVANVTGDVYPTTVEGIKDILEQQIASPVQWVKGLETMYDRGVRMFVEVGPKKALKGFVDDVLGQKEDVLGQKEDVWSLFTNHPKTGELPTFNHAICGLYAAGYGLDASRDGSMSIQTNGVKTPPPSLPLERRGGADPALLPPQVGEGRGGVEALSQALAQLLQQGAPAVGPRIFDRNETPQGSVVVSGTGLGLPGPLKSVMDPDNALRILQGEQFIDLIPERFRQMMVDKRITRLVKSADGSGSFETIGDTDDVIKLAGRAGSFDLSDEYGVPAKLVEALDTTTQLAMAAGLDALREAGIPLVQTYKRTTKGTYLPERWILPEALRNETGVIFASAFPGLARVADEFERYYTWESRRAQLAELEDLRRYTSDSAALQELNRRITALRETLNREPYEFDRRFLFRVLAMGHSQFAEYIGARGPNTHINAACASTAQGVALAEDWIRSGRCRRVIVIGGDNVTGDNLMEWIGAGFLSMGATATEDRVDEAALPFDRRRHGTILGMGACGLVVESEDAARERGMRGIVEVLSSETANSAFHGTRLDVNHIADMMNNLVTAAERRFGLNRFSMAAETVFMSHETYTPARGGSASAEVVALRKTFGDAANGIIVANTKGLTGHPMGVGIEDVIAVKILEHGIVPPVPNFKELDPDLGTLNLSRGGRYPVKYALHLAAGFGSQISFTLLRRVPGGLDRQDNVAQYQRWLADVSGYDQAQTEIVKRVLRVQAQGAPMRQPVPSSWQYGTGPTVRAASPGDGAISEYRPAPMVAPTRQTTDDRPPTTMASAPEPVVRRPSSVVESVKPTAIAPAPESIKPTTDDRPQTVVAAPPLQASISPETTVDPVTETVLAVVAEKTGYPSDMLDIDLDLEADLGVDTVKQAETLAAIRESFDIPFQEGLNLRDYPTLEKVIGFVHEMRPDLAAVQPTTDDRRQTTTVSAPELVVSSPSSVVDAPSGDPVTATVLGIVADKTGYPEEMLELDLDMEADLGVDTVKQAETFAAIRESFDIPFREDLNLRDYPTLEKVIGFVHEMRPDLASAPEPVVSSPSSVVEAPSGDPVTATVLGIVAGKTGYPEEMLELDLDMEADLGVDTVKQAETFAAIRESFDIPFREDLNLRDYPTLEKVIGFVHEMRPDLAVQTTDDSRPTTAAAAPEPVVSGPSSVVDASASDGDPVTATVLGIVADKTGYPEEMLELDLDMEADLGVDTVKQAETFAAIRESFDIPFREDLNLRDYPTLEKVIGFVHEMRPDLAAAQPTTADRPPTTATAPAPEPVVSRPSSVVVEPIGSLEEADKMPRRVPTPMLRPVLDLCEPTGVTLDEQSRVVIMLDRAGVGKSLVTRLEKLGVTTLVIEPAPDTDALTSHLQSWLAEGPIQGVYWLPALDVEPNLEEMTLDEWRELNRVRVKNLYAAMRTLYDSVSGPGTFLVSATRLGGLHGYGSDAASAPLGGAVTGFTKAYSIEQGMRENGALTVKAVDFEVSRKTAEPADQLIAETLVDPGVVEVGYHDGLRYTVTLTDQPAADGQPGMELNQDSVFVVTGAAGGITSAIVTDLAVASQGVFYLLDLVEAPARDDETIRLFRADVEALKSKLIEEARAAGERPTPVQINNRIAEIERNEAALRAIETVEAAGGTAHYHSVNLMDADSVAAVVDDVRQRYGRIDVLLHAGGLLIDRTLPDKEPDQFNLVFDVKADGFFNLIKSAAGMPIGATVSFSSVAGRFGNNGQSDYSSANDLLCKISSSMRSWRPDTRAIAIDWTAWGSIGMASRGSVPQIMEALGIDMLQPEAGVPTIRRELTYGGTRGEVLVAGRLGAWVEEKDPTGGLDTDKVNAMLAERDQPLAMLGEVKAAKLYGGLIVETELNPMAEPFLYDHQVEQDVAWLPGVMGTESMVQAASILTPGYRVVSVENQRNLGAFKFHRNKPQTMRLTANIRPSDEGDLLADVLLQSIFQPPRLELPVQIKDHFAATVRMTKANVEGPTIDFTAPNADDLPITADEIYEVFFHGPTYQVMERAQVEGDRALSLMAEGLPPNASTVGVAELTAPRVIEHMVQAAALWSTKTNGVMALPAGYESVTVYRLPSESNGQRLYALTEAIDGDKLFDVTMVDASGNVYIVLQGYETVSLPS